MPPVRNNENGNAPAPAPRGPKRHRQQTALDGDIDGPTLEELEAYTPPTFGSAPRRVGASDPQPPAGTGGCRLTVVETVFHQSPDEGATSSGGNFERELRGGDQVYARRLTVGPEWQKLDTGWLGGRCSQIHISNEEGKRWDKVPTAEERGEAASRIVEVGIDVADAGGGAAVFALVRSGESCRFEPSDARLLYLRCRRDGAKCRVTAVPL